MGHVIGLKLVDNYRRLVQLKTTVHRQTLASVLKQINQYDAQHIVANDLISGGMARGRYGYDVGNAKALIRNPVRRHGTRLSSRASIGVPSRS